MSATTAIYTPPQEIQAPSFHHALPTNPAALLLSRMEPKALRELAEDIKVKGQKMPVVVLVDGENNRSLLDGISRLEALELLGRQVVKNGALNADTVLFQEISGVDPFAYVLSVNLHRRHLKHKDKRELAGKLLDMFPHKSDRQIAELAGLSHPTIKEVRSELERCGKIFHISNRTDATGKRRQPATKPPKESREAQPVPAASPQPAKTDGDDAALKENCAARARNPEAPRSSNSQQP
jgi:ParB-like chromosome segregation protein Spo0J